MMYVVQLSFTFPAILRHANSSEPSRISECETLSTPQMHAIRFEEDSRVFAPVGCRGVIMQAAPEFQLTDRIVHPMDRPLCRTWLLLAPFPCQSS